MEYKLPVITGAGAGECLSVLELTEIFWYNSYTKDSGGSGIKQL